MQYISRKMQKMVDDIKENKGDLSMRLEVTGGDEIGSVGRNVNAFINTLQDIMASITDSAAEMNRVILEVDNKVCLSNDNSNDISISHGRIICFHGVGYRDYFRHYRQYAGNRE